MRMSGSAQDLFSHMKLLGLAAIVSSYRSQGGGGSLSPVTVWWESPDTMTLSTVSQDITVEEAAECVRTYLDDLIRDVEVIQRTVKVGGKGHSPLSPRIAKELNDGEWASYQSARQSIVDHSEREVPFFANLVNALGFPAYWSTTLDESKGKPNLDLGASLWEMAPRNQGSEFMKNKYLKHMHACERLSVSDIVDRINGDGLDHGGELRNASGLHSPAYIDLLLSFIALSGIELFPTRPITVGKAGSVSTAVTTQRVDGRKRSYFVLPITRRAVTLERYKSICRNSAIYRIADAAVCDPSFSKTEPLMGASATWLHSHDVSHLVVFHRFIGGTPSCPEYYANEGGIVSV